MYDLSFVRNVLMTLPSLVEMARLRPELSHEEVAAHWLSVPSSYRVPLSYTASDELVGALGAAEEELVKKKAMAARQASILRGLGEWVETLPEQARDVERKAVREEEENG